MSLNFPSSPTVGQQYPATLVPGSPVYQWDGEKWKTFKITGAQPATSPPLMDSISTAGLSSNWSRGDHRHPYDTTRAPLASPTFTGTLTASTFSITDWTCGGRIVAAAKGHLFGWVGGNSYGTPLATTDANMLFYTPAAGNWCGMGTDGGGNFWIRTGGAGSTNTAAFAANADLTCGFSNTPYAPTRPNGSNDGYAATTAFVIANQPVGGPYLPLSGGTITGTLTVSYGHVMPYRAGATGVMYLSYNDRYLYFNGTAYYMPGGLLRTAAGRIWGTSDFGVNTWTYGARVGPHAGDQLLGTAAGLTESWAGAIITGGSGPQVGGATHRYRYHQIAVNGTWWTASNA